MCHKVPKVWYSTCASIDDDEEDEKVALKLLSVLLAKKGTTDALKYMYEECQVMHLCNVFHNAQRIWSGMFKKSGTDYKCTCQIGLNLTHHPFFCRWQKVLKMLQRVILQDLLHGLPVSKGPTVVRWLISSSLNRKCFAVCSHFQRLSCYGLFHIIYSTLNIASRLKR